jgi:aldehyde dehydrogenase (NAD+)
MIEGTVARGDGTLATGGGRLGGDLADGFYVSPTLFTDIDNQSEIAQNEIFGPVLAAIRFTDEEHAIALANDTTYGLSAYLHTNDLNRAHRIASALDAGNVAVNGGQPMAGPYAPFGGFKQSGYGKQGGYAGLLEFIRTKNVNINIS